MTRTTEAIFTNGVLRPTEALPLREQERVRITVESIAQSNGSREEAVRRFLEGTEKLKLLTDGPLPTRDELHERG